MVICLLVPSSLTRTAHKWQDFLHTAAPATLEHHADHHVAGHFDDVAHSHAPDAGTEHHRDHHAEQRDHSHDQALLSAFKWSPASQQFLFMPPVAVLANTSVLPSPRELKPFGRDGPEAESPPSEHLFLPLAGRAPPVV